MKKFLSLILIIAVLLSLAACARVESIIDAEVDSDKAETAQKSGENKTVTVCIDPGHGFGDIGCENKQINGYEKDLTLSLSKVLKEAFEKEGVQVILTHDGQSFPSVSQIVKEADALGVDYNLEKMEDNDVFGKYERAIWENVLDKKYSLDMFISVHINSLEGHPEVRGASVDYCSENPYQKMLKSFCKTLSKNLTSEGISDSCKIFEDLPEDAYVVTKYSTAPSVLIEVGYATSPEDAKDMTSENWQKDFAAVLCKSVLAHVGDK